MTISGENTVQTMGTDAPTEVRMRRSASICSPSAPALGSAGFSPARSAAPESGTSVVVYFTWASEDGAYLSPHISAKACARDCGLRKSQSKCWSWRKVSSASPSAEFLGHVVMAPERDRHTSTGSPRSAASTRARLSMAQRVRTCRSDVCTRELPARYAWLANPTCDALTASAALALFRA